MKTFKTCTLILATLAAGFLGGCSSTPTKSPEVADAIRKSLNQSGLKNVSVTQDRDKGVITLAGNVADDNGKAQAESIAKGLAGGQVVADQIAVVPANATHDTRTLYTDLDKGIQSNLDAALIQNRIPGTLRHTTKNGVVTLSGTVDSQQARTQAQQVASSVPNVQQVVNELQVKDQKASSSR